MCPELWKRNIWEIKFDFSKIIYSFCLYYISFISYIWDKIDTEA